MNSHKQTELIKKSFDELRIQQPEMMFLGMTNSTVIESDQYYLECECTYSSNVSNNIHEFTVEVKWENDTWNYTFVEHFNNSKYYGLI